MNKEQVIQDNITIAKFMGWTIEVRVSGLYPHLENHTTVNTRVGGWDMGQTVFLSRADVDEQRRQVDENLWRNLTHPEYGRCGQYHTDWNRLVEVFQRIHAIIYEWEYDTPERDKFEEIFDFDYIASELLLGDIQGLRSRCITFINWYNDEYPKLAARVGEDEEAA